MDFNIIIKMTNDIKKASVTLTDTEARYLVDTYYMMQKNRIRSTNQIKAIDKPYNDWQKKYNKATKDFYEKGKGSEEDLQELVNNFPEREPHETLDYFSKNYMIMEDNIRLCLKHYAESKPIGKWLMSIIGIGPVIAAGLIAHIDIKKVQTAGQIQAFGGLDPNRKWNKGEKRPWNAQLKTLYWKVGQSFIKTCNNPKDVYGHIYTIRKQYEIEKNNNFDYADQAADILKNRTFKNDPVSQAMKACYEEGKLPPSHINSRAARYATKIFLSHFFSVWYEMDRGEKPPKPYPIAILNHAHEIPIPNWHND